MQDKAPFFALGGVCVPPACIVVIGECQQGCTHTHTHTHSHILLHLHLSSCPVTVALLICFFTMDGWTTFLFLLFLLFTSPPKHSLFLLRFGHLPALPHPPASLHSGPGLINKKRIKLNAEYNIKQPRGQGNCQTVLVLARHQDHHSNSGKTLYRLPRPKSVDLLWHPRRRRLDPDQQHVLPSYRRPPGTVSSILSNSGVKLRCEKQNGSN